MRQFLGFISSSRNLNAPRQRKDESFFEITVAISSRFSAPRALAWNTKGVRTSSSSSNRFSYSFSFALALARFRVLVIRSSSSILAPRRESGIQDAELVSTPSPRFRLPAQAQRTLVFASSKATPLRVKVTLKVELHLLSATQTRFERF